MRWEREPYKTFQRLVRKAEADLEARMVTALTSQVHVPPELALAILERKFPDRWSKALVVVGPPAVNLNLGEMLTRVVGCISSTSGHHGIEPAVHSSQDEKEQPQRDQRGWSRSRQSS